MNWNMNGLHIQTEKVIGLQFDLGKSLSTSLNGEKRTSIWTMANVSNTDTYDLIIQHFYIVTGDDEFP